VPGWLRADGQLAALRSRAQDRSQPPALKMRIRTAEWLVLLLRPLSSVKEVSPGNRADFTKGGLGVVTTRDAMRNGPDAGHSAPIPMPSSARKKNRKAKFGENPATRLQAEYQPLIDHFSKHQLSPILPTCE
jgi:hypothetical protein